MKAIARMMRWLIERWLPRATGAVQQEAVPLGAEADVRHVMEHTQ